MLEAYSGRLRQWVGMGRKQDTGKTFEFNGTPRQFANAAWEYSRLKMVEDPALHHPPFYADLPGNQRFRQPDHPPDISHAVIEFWDEYANATVMGVGGKTWVGPDIIGHLSATERPGGKSEIAVESLSPDSWVVLKTMWEGFRDWLVEKHWMEVTKTQVARRGPALNMQPKPLPQKEAVSGSPDEKAKLPKADTVLQLGRAGRPRDPLYDQAHEKIQAGESETEVYKWWLKQRGTVVPDKGIRDSFKKAMKRREIKGRNKG